MKAWLKGGLIGIIVYYGVLFSLALIIAFSCKGPGCTTIFSIFVYPSIMLLNKSLMGSALLGIVYNIILAFIIGALIGLMVGKIKRKKGVVNE